MSYGGYSRTNQYVPPKVTARPKVRLRVSYNLQTHDEVQQRHCFGINSLAFNEEEGLLFSAGRDSTIRCWDANKLPVPEHTSCFEHHTDWVNDIFLCTNNRTLVSCSSDASIKVWDTPTSICTRTLNGHGDYAKALAYAPRADVFASGGLDSNIFVWDLQQCTVPVVTLPVNSSPSLNSSSGFRSNVVPRVRTGLDKGSIYSLAMNDTANIVLSGSTEKLVRAWDPRSGQKLFKLKGHTDNIKALCVNSEGTLCISGSSDFTLRLWDLRQQQCIHVFEIHDDSVWSVAADPNFTNVFSGGRDGSVFVTDLVSSHSTLVCNEPFPIVKLLHTRRAGDSLWVTTTDSCIKNWGLESTALVQRRVYSPPITLSSSPTTSSLHGPKPAPIVSAPRATILGRPGMIKHHILNNRRHVLTKDSSGAVELWDITKVKQLESYGVVNFESKLESLTEVVSVPNWFSADTKTGSLTVHLDCPQCFSAEVYSGDVFDDLPPEDEEIQMNLGESVLRALFSRWEEGRRALESRQKFEHMQRQALHPQHSQHLPPIHQPPQAPLQNSQQQHTQQLPPIHDRLQPNGVHDGEIPRKLSSEKIPSSSREDNGAITPNAASAPNSPHMEKSTTSTNSTHLAPHGNSLSHSTNISNSTTLSNPATSSSLSNSTAISNSQNLNHSSNLAHSSNLTSSTGVKPNNTNISNNTKESNTSNTTNNMNSTNNPNNATNDSPREHKLPVLTMPESISVIISEEGAGGTIHRAQRSQFVGDESHEIIPQWVIECLIHNEIPPARSTTKIGFYLTSADEKDLPAFPQGNGRLSAHRLLRMRKVANYVASKLELELPLLPDSPVKTENPDEKEGDNSTNSSENDDTEKYEERVSPEQYIDILCNNKVLSPTYSLATVKAFFWKSGDDIVLNYRVNPKYKEDSEKFKNSPRTKKNGSTNQKKHSNGKRTNPFRR